MIKIICVGKLKEEYITNLVNDYKKRITKYHKIEIIELKDENDLLKESISINKYLDTKDYLIVLDIFGKELSSEELANKINNAFNSYSTISFVIGSSIGIHDDIKAKASLLLSFGKITIPHGLFRGVLLEQIYRSFKIINNETYHK